MQEDSSMNIGVKSDLLLTDQYKKGWKIFVEDDCLQLSLQGGKESPATR
jgi:hypothetical protein